MIILGPTASGKTKLATYLAFNLNGEIISADSRQVYRNMNIGTGKDLDDYNINDTKIAYHLIDILDAGQKYNVSEFQKDFINAHKSILERNKTPIVCGGTGMYIESIIKNWDYTNVPINENLRLNLISKSKEELLDILNTFNTNFRSKADTSTHKRIIRAIEICSFEQHNTITNNNKTINNFTVFGLDISRETRRKRISDRLQARLSEGMIQEVKNLLDNGISPEQLIYYGLEYKFITQYLTGCISLNDMTTQLEFAIHQFAKRQMTYFRKMEKDGILIHWINAEVTLEEQYSQILKTIKH